MVAFLGTDHSRVECTEADIGRVFPQVIWHTEIPVLRTAPAPMYLLSQLVHESGFKVVLTGEGADEFLAGYNIFKEAKIRRFWARQPDSRIRPLLLRKLYPYITPFSSQSGAYLEAFFKTGMTEVEDPIYSHAVRWRNTASIKNFADPARFPYNVPPLAFLNYDEERIFEGIAALGWQRPDDTDPNSTNCLLNAFANQVHKRQTGHHPYVLELANLVREGHLSREEALARVETPENP